MLHAVSRRASVARVLVVARPLERAPRLRDQRRRRRRRSRRRLRAAARRARAPPARGSRRAPSRRTPPCPGSSRCRKRRSGSRYSDRMRIGRAFLALEELATQVRQRLVVHHLYCSSRILSSYARTRPTAASTTPCASRHRPSKVLAAFFDHARAGLVVGRRHRDRRRPGRSVPTRSSGTTSAAADELLGPVRRRAARHRRSTSRPARASSSPTATGCRPTAIRSGRWRSRSPAGRRSGTSGPAELATVDSRCRSRSGVETAASGGSGTTSCCAAAGRRLERMKAYLETGRGLGSQGI